MSLFNGKRSKAAARKAPSSVRLHLEALEDRLVPATTTYTVAVGDVATLIADLNAANTNGPNTQTTINLTQGTYDFTAANNNTYGPNALPAITGNVVINGNGAVLERDPSLGVNTPFRLFYVSGGQVSSSSTTAAGSLTLENLTLEGGLAEGGNSGTGGGSLGAGGAIYNQGNLTLNGVTVTQNIAIGGSTGVGTATNGGSIGDKAGNFGLGGNVGGAGGFGGGGGAASSSGGAGGAGGFGAGAGNGTTGGGGLGAGGAIFNQDGAVTLINSTLANNLASGGLSAGTTGDGYGGAVFNLDGTLNIVTSTLADNSNTGTATGGGAVYNLAFGLTTNSQGVPSTVNLTDSILADSIGGSDLANDQNTSTAGSAVVNSTTPNIVMALSNLDGATVNGSPSTANPLLGALANNGGPTQTMALSTGSPALGAGANAANVPTTDQRGVTRGTSIDLGAYQGSTSTGTTGSSTLTLTSSATTVAPGQSVTLTAVITSSTGAAAPAGYVTFVDTTNNQTLSTVLVAPVNGQAEADLTTNSLPAGTNQITVTYQSSNGLTGSSGNITINVGGGSTTNSQWLSQVYQDLLGRAVDPTGQSGWGALLSAGVSRGVVAYLITQTPEYMTDQINAAYKQMLNAVPDSTSLATYVGEMETGATIQTIESQIAGANSYYVTNGDSPAGFLGALYQNFLNRPLDSTGSTDYQALLAAGQTTTQVAAAVLLSQEYSTDLVQQDYQTYLGRAADPTSLAADVAFLMAGGNNDVIVATLLSNV